MRALLIPLLALACAEDPPCTTLFGRPNVKTGLGAERCAPSCACEGRAFDSPEWTSDRVAALRAWTLLDPPAPLDADPYASAAPQPSSQVCAVEIVDRAQKTYRTRTYATESAAGAAGAILTHHDACGLCSSLADLAVYAEQLDLTAPVRQCGLDTLREPIEANVACLERLGFTRPCAQIWAFNTRHTRDACFEPCFALIEAPYHEPSGALNACLRCDEEKSGPVFKAVAGRTRRNTGIASALCRPCAEARPVAHRYD